MKKQFLCTGLLFLTALSASAAKTKHSAIYTNLRSFPIYAKAGFDPADTLRPPVTDDWQIINTAVRPSAARVMDFNFDIPKRRFLSPFSTPEMEFTYAIPFTLGAEKIAVMRDSGFIPGMFFPGIGDNWEIYLNGHLIRSEMHLDDAGHIASHRGMRELYFPVDKNLFRAGENQLTFKIVGDPNYDSTGFFYSSPDYIDDYKLIEAQNNEAVESALIAIYIFMGIYHLFMYSLRRKDVNNLFYGLLSMVLGVYLFTRTTVIYSLFPNTDVVYRLEFFCLYLFFPLGSCFMEYFSTQKIFLTAKISILFYGIMALSQLFCSLAYSEDTLLVWQASTLVSVPLFCIVDIGYLFTISLKQMKKRYAEKNYSLPLLCLKTLLETPCGNLTLGTLACLATAIIDLVGFFFMEYKINTIRYGFTVLTVGITLILARKLNSLHKQQERVIIRSKKCMNTKLVDWIVVQDRDPDNLPSRNTDTTVLLSDIRGFTSLSEDMPSQSVTGFLTGLNEALAQPLFVAEDQGHIAYTDKFMGDAVMNIFNNPHIALETAIRIRIQLQKFNDNPAAFFPAAPPGMHVDIGIGIASGPVTLGVMGHSRRLDYTPIGDTVNMASRLESLTKEYHAPILVNDVLYRSIRPEDFHLRHIDRIRVKGKMHPVDIYEEFSCDLPEVQSLKNEALIRFLELQEMYFAGKNWEDAIHLAEFLAQKGDPVAQIYGRRMRAISASPDLLAHWDGVYTFSEK